MAEAAAPSRRRAVGPRAAKASRSQGFVRLASSYRSATAAETLARATPLMDALGISRVTDITRMDRLGLPVFASVRPRGKVLRVHAGKGLHAIEARIGALMEAVEFAVADPDTQTWTARTRTIAELMSSWDDGLRFADFAPRLGADLTPQRAVTTVACEHLRTGRRVDVPAELVFFPLALADDHVQFGASTNGLASGNTLEEATLHALFEVLERDAISMNKPRDQSTWIEHQSLPAPFKDMANAWHAEGIELAVRSVPNACGLACFEAFVHESGGSQVNLAGGSGLHPDAHIALARAVCEAAQSRLSHIHGGRDDVTLFYAKYSAWTPEQLHGAERLRLSQIFDQSRRASFCDVAKASGRMRSPTDLPTLLDDLLQQLKEAGFDAVFRYRFPMPVRGLQVVRVVVPRCENIEHQTRRFGPRLMKLLLAHA